MKAGDLEVDSTNEEIYKKILYEFAKTESNNVEVQLGDENQIMVVIDDKLESIKTSIEKFKTLVNNRFEKSEELVSKLVNLQMENRKKENKIATKLNKELRKRKKERLEKFN